MIDHARELRRYASVLGRPTIMLDAADEIERLAAKLEAAEKDIALKERIIDSLGSELNAVANERDELRAKIEQQKPVGIVHRYGRALNGSAWLGVAWNPEADELPTGTAIYALPGAQPAPSVPEATWLPVPDKHPTFDPVDLQLADGSVLCGCVPQIDGDYWWKGPSGEVFIDPRYAPVTHWRLAAAQEAKP